MGCCERLSRTGACGIEIWFFFSSGKKNHDEKKSAAIAILIIIEGQSQVFQRFSSSRLVDAAKCGGGFWLV
jgi:hypothetical protein